MEVNNVFWIKDPELGKSVRLTSPLSKVQVASLGSQALRVLRLPHVYHRDHYNHLQNASLLEVELRPSNSQIDESLELSALEDTVVSTVADDVTQPNP